MNYTTLGVINSAPRERIISDSHNLSSVFIRKFRTNHDSDLLMGVLAKCAANHQASGEDHHMQTMNMEHISTTTTGNGVKSHDRKIKLSFSVDRLLGNDETTCTVEGDDHADRSIIINRQNCPLDDSCNKCSIGHDCCKSPPRSATYMNHVHNFLNRSGSVDVVSIVRPLPIRITNNMSTALPTSISATFNGIAQLLKYQTPPTGSGQGTANCVVNNLKSIQGSVQQFRQEGSIIHHHNNGGGGGSNNPPVSTGKRKRSWSRAVFSNLQRKGLEIQFQQQKYITKPDRRKLAARLNLTDAQVKVWFQNRRMKWRHTRENLKSGQEKSIDELPKSNDDETISSSEDEIDVVAE